MAWQRIQCVEHSFVWSCDHHVCRSRRGRLGRLLLAIVRLEPQLPPGVNGVREPELVPDADVVPEPTPKTRSSTLE